MVFGPDKSGKQRQRWESGGFSWSASKPAIAAGRRAPTHRICLDLAVDLLVLPLSYTVLNIALLPTRRLYKSGCHDAGWLW